ncbi:hypothetical protein [Alteriqipengyuania sp.]|uniref:hypothetical protein n=1 Tax=Alteriqipengyuania sp. TaxID=2800692 RepID=UPI003511730A
MSEHQCFTVKPTAFLRTLSREEMNDAIAVHYQKPPQRTERGTTFGLCFPILVVPGYVENREEMAAKVAAILNEHWAAEQAEVPA